MTTPTPNRTQDHVYGDRMLTWFESHPQQWETLVANGLERFALELKFEAWLDDRAREAAMNRHPAGKGRGFSGIDVQVYDECQPDPDFTGQFYARSTRSLLADVFWAVVEIFAPNRKSAKR